MLDRPGSRRIVAQTEGGEVLEFDTAPEVDVIAGQSGFVRVLRGKIFTSD